MSWEDLFSPMILELGYKCYEGRDEKGACSPETFSIYMQLSR